MPPLRGMGSKQACERAPGSHLVQHGWQGQAPPRHFVHACTRISHPAFPPHRPPASCPAAPRSAPAPPLAPPASGRPPPPAPNPAAGNSCDPPGAPLPEPISLIGVCSSTVHLAAPGPPSRALRSAAVRPRCSSPSPPPPPATVGARPPPPPPAPVCSWPTDGRWQAGPSSASHASRPQHACPCA